MSHLPPSPDISAWKMEADCEWWIFSYAFNLLGIKRAVAGNGGFMPANVGRNVKKKYTFSIWQPFCFALQRKNCILSWIPQSSTFSFQFSPTSFIGRVFICSICCLNTLWIKQNSWWGWNENDTKLVSWTCQVSRVLIWNHNEMLKCLKMQVLPVPSTDGR